MAITASNLAAGVGATAQNVQFQASATVIPRAVVVLGTGITASYTANSVIVDKPQLITSSAQASSLYGAGSPLARVIAAVFAGSNGAVKVWAIPETEPAAAATQASAFTFTAVTPGVGTVAVYVNGAQYTAATTAATTPTTLAAAISAAINADANCPVTSTPTAGVLALTAKGKGSYGNLITLAYSCQPGDALPTGVTVATVALATGTAAVTATLTTDLQQALGIGSSANLLPDGTQATEIVTTWGQDQNAMTAIATYNGLGNSPTGLYDDTVGRPLRALWADITNIGVVGATTLTTLVALGTTNISDRCNGLVAVPGSLTHPCDIAGVAIGVMASINKNRAEQNYIGQILPGVDPGYAAILSGGRWTDQYTNRDTAVQAGISPTICVGSSVALQNVVTFYHPVSVPVTSNIYREMVNISKLQNIIASIRTNFSGPKWVGYSIVSNTANVTIGTSRLMARDLDSVIDDFVALSKSWAANAWIYDYAFTVKALANKANPAVQLRVGGDGFACNVPVILSGVGNIIDTMISADISLAVLNN